MAQLYPTNPMNALWIIPESHDKGKVDLKSMIADNGGSDQLPGAVPLLCAAGDVAVCSRQMVHCSFPNRSDQQRVTYVFGFHRRVSVEGVQGWDVLDKKSFCYDKERIHRRSRMIQLAIDARQQCYPAETPYVYLPMAEEADLLRWSDETRETVLRNYNQLDLGI
jgi:ectoine hydroxylase-related dioxygenase (phytanoyl-CoA dioxygenase family)